MKGRLKITPSFKGLTCLHPPENGNEAHKIKLGKFCYLGCMLSAGGGAEASSITRVRTGRKKFRELLPLLTSRVFSHKMKGNIYKACVSGAMLYGSETWPVKREDTCRLQRTEMQMARWMCKISLSERRPSAEIPDGLGIQNISVAMRQMRLRWLGHIERIDTNNWVSKCRSLVIEGTTGKGRARKTWDQVVQSDLQHLHLKKEFAQDRDG